MANTKISALTELAETPASGDLLPIVDISDLTMGVSGTTKKFDANRVFYKAGGGTVSAATTFSSTLSVTGTNPYFANAVGFGTATPAARIHTHTSDDEHFRINHTSATGSPYISFFQAGTRRAFIQFTDTNDTLSIVSEYGDIAFKAASTAGSDSDTEYIRLKAGGSIGFGTNSPTAKYHFEGDVYVNGRIGEEWTGLSFVSGWGDYSVSYNSGQYKKIGDIVMLRGLVVRTSGSSANIAILPSGYRPAKTLIIQAVSYYALAVITIHTTGEITLDAGSPTVWVSLNGITFSTL